MYYPSVHGVSEQLTDRVGFTNFDRHVDTQEPALDEYMRVKPWFDATVLPNAQAENLVRPGVGGRLSPRPVLDHLTKKA